MAAGKEKAAFCRADLHIADRGRAVEPGGTFCHSFFKGGRVSAPRGPAARPGAEALVHSALRKDIISRLPGQRIRNTLDYQSSPEEAGETAQRADAMMLILTHYVPSIPPGEGVIWSDLTATCFSGSVESGDDLHRG